MIDTGIKPTISSPLMNDNENDNEDANNIPIKTAEKITPTALPTEPEHSRNISSYEKIIEQIGGFGSYQKIIFILIQAGDLFAASIMFLPVVLNAKSDWHCNGNFSFNSIKNQSDGERCDCENRFYTNRYTSIVTTFGLVCELKWVPRAINFIQMLGIPLGAWMFGLACDKFGRRHTFFISILVLILPCFLTIFSPNWQLYAFLRFLVGMGFGGMQVINSVYPLEIVSSKYRSLAGTLGFWSYGSLLFTGIAYLLTEWRHLVMAITLSSVPYFLTWFLVPESPRWLIQHDRYHDALTVLQRIAKRNKKTCPNLNVIKSVTIRDAKKQSVFKIFKSKTYTFRLIVLSLNWYVIYSTYYVVWYGCPQDLIGNVYLSMAIMGFIDLPGMLSVIVLNNRIGRKKAMLFYSTLAMTGMFGMFVIKILKKDRKLSVLLYCCALMAKGATVSGMYILRIITAESYPTIVRSTAVATSSVVGCLGTVSAPMIILIGDYLPVGPYLISFLLFAIALPLFIWRLTETKGLSLSDSFKDHKMSLIRNASKTDNNNCDADKQAAIIAAAGAEKTEQRLLISGNNQKENVTFY